MNRDKKRFKMVLLAAAAGAMAFSFVTPVLGQTNMVSICFRNRTIKVPEYLVQTYLYQGAVPGPCQVSSQ